MAESRDAIAAVCGLVRAMSEHGIVTPQEAGPPGQGDGTVQVHLSFGPDEYDGMLLKAWRDPKDERLHIVVQWKP